MNTLNQFQNRENPVDVTVVGLGFMGLGFISLIRTLPNLRVPLVISRRVSDACFALQKIGLKTTIPNDSKRIENFCDAGVVCVSDNLDLLKDYQNDLVVSMGGTIDYETKVAIQTLEAKKPLVTMNVELQATLGTELKKIADRNDVIITDVLGDQPGSLARFINETRLMGFETIMAGNFKRFLNYHATQELMKPWADEKGTSVCQVTSFTDGTKQSLEMNLVANYFGMKVMQPGMKGPQIEKIQDVLDVFDWNEFPAEGIVDYVIGKELFPGIFLVVEHNDLQQRKYLRYLSLGDGPQYVLFEPYHLCHLEIPETIGQVIFSNQPVINNGLEPNTITVAIAKKDLKKDQILGGVGDDDVYGCIENIESKNKFLPIGLAHNTKLKRDIPKDMQIELDDIELPKNTATKLAGF